jgi:hypothetical protein
VRVPATDNVPLPVIFDATDSVPPMLALLLVVRVPSNMIPPRIDTFEATVNALLMAVGPDITTLLVACRLPFTMTFEAAVTVPAKYIVPFTMALLWAVKVPTDVNAPFIRASVAVVTIPDTSSAPKIAALL